MPDAQPTAEARLRTLGRRLAAGTALVGLLVLAGWIFERPWLTQLHPHWVSMKVNTALGFVLAGTALYARHRGLPSALAYGLASGLLALLGLATLLQYLFAVDLGIDQWLLTEAPGAVTTSHPGRMAPASAVGFFFLGLAMALQAGTAKRAQALAPTAALLVALIALLAILGYTYDVESLFRFRSYTGMALHAALLFLALSFALLSLDPQRGPMRVLSSADAGGLMARRLLPYIVFVPLVLGWLRLEGQRLGWYDTAFGIALSTLLTIVLLMALAMNSARAINRLDQGMQTQSRLQESILSSVGEGIVVIDTHLRFQVFNPAAQALLGLGATQAPPEDWGRLYGVFHPDSHKPLDPQEYPLTRALQGQAINQEEQFIRNAQRPDGLYISVSARPIRDDSGAIAGAVAVFRDISETRQSHAALAQAAAYDRSLGSVLALFNTGFEREKILNELLRQLAEAHALPVSAFYAYQEWSGCYRLEAARGAPDALLREFRHGEGVIGQSALDNRSLLLAEGLAGLSLETGLFKIPPAAVLISPVSYGERRLGVLVFAASKPQTERDVAFIERLAAQLGVALTNVKHYDELKVLAAQLRQRGEEIVAKNQALENASRLKSEFLANMSHELRTPLNAIIGFTEVMRDGLLGTVNDKQREHLGDIFDSAQHLLSLINDILDLSKIEAGRLILDRQPIDLAELLPGCLAIVREQALSQHVELTLELAPGLGPLQADPRKLKQILYNLLSNAVKFTPEGGKVTLAARQVDAAVLEQAAGPQELRLPLPEPACPHYLELAVSDSGIGMAAEDLPRLFQAFVQLEGPLTKRFAGTGLGLALVRKLVELHGGTLTVASTPGTGSRFAVYLPFSSAAVASAGSGPALERPAGRLALVVEDDTKAADLVRTQLQGEGYAVMVAGTAAQALDLARQYRPDLITLDILLPDADGWELLTRFKALAQTAQVPVVIISIVADPPRGFSLGAVAVLTKPYRREELQQALASLGFPKDLAAARVLVIDDDPLAVELIATQLGNAGCEVLRAYGGADGIASARHSRPDLILLDLMMPDVNGFQVAEALKADPDTARIPIVVLTAKLLSADDKRALDGHVREIVAKADFQPARFLLDVRRAMARGS